MEFKKGCPYGTHRVISPKGVLPQPADVIDNTMELYDNEVLIDVKTLNVDSASFTKAALGAEGVGKDVNMLIGNGYTKGHANAALQVLREDERIMKLFAELYA